MGLHYDNPNPPGDDPLRTQRMTADEAASVIALWQQERVEQTGLTDRPAVPDVAEGLDIPVEEVQRLLGEVRARRLEGERADPGTGIVGGSSVGEWCKALAPALWFIVVYGIFWIVVHLIDRPLH